MKGKSYIGYKFLFFMAMATALSHAAAGSYYPFYDLFAPDVDSPEVAKPVIKNINDSLHFPLRDKTGDPYTDYKTPRSLDLNDPRNVRKGFEYDPATNRYNYNEKIGGEFLRNPTYLTLDEYTKYRGKQDEDAYWQRRLASLMLFNKTPELPQMYKEGLFNRIFGSDALQVKPQGNVDVTFGGNWQNIKNPTLTQRAQKYGVFDFDMQMNINLLATVGDKLKLNISNNTKATFDYQNVQKLDYSGKEDEMLKKIEAGNVSFPLKSNLINGVQSLFGLKLQLQFGKLWVTGIVSQQKSQRKSLTVQGGAQAQQIAIKANNYEENKDFLLGHYFRNNYNTALKDFPRINSQVTINRMEVWVTNRTGAVTGVRDVMCFMDLGEANPYLQSLSNPNSGIRNGLPDNNANRLYEQLQYNPGGRLPRSAVNALIPLGLQQGQDYEHTTARQLTASEFSFNAQLGYIMLNTQLNADEVLGVAYRYTYRGKVYQVGEFAADLPPDTSNPKVLFLKLMKGTSARPSLPVWDLMMKNVYALGGFGVSRENFTLNIMYQDPGGGEKRYMPEGEKEGVPFITLLNLDRLNAQNEPSPDGVFDFVEGFTINTQQGKVIFPVLEPFGSDLAPSVIGPTDPNTFALRRKYLYQVLYDSTKTIALQSQQNDRFILRGSYKSSSSSEIFLGGFNIPPGSVSVAAGGTKLVENQDYTIDYGLGRIKIINTGILNSGVPINIQYEDNATFGFQQQNFMAARLDYYLNKNLTLGGTIMQLKERPFTQQVNFGEDPIQNTVIGLDANYQSEVPALTRVLDKLPIYATTAPSFTNVNVEVAGLLPGHPKQIEALDPEGSVYIDNFEGTSSSYDLKYPTQAWALAATPRGAINKFGQVLFPESAQNNDLAYGRNRARLAWYSIEPTLVDPGSLPKYVKDDPNQHYIRMVQQQDVFPNLNTQPLLNALSTFDLGFYPKERGPYNFDATNLNPDGSLTNPGSRWGGITRAIDNTDFEASNVEYIQFWVMDPFLTNTNPAGGGGSLYLNLGNISEDILKDSRLFFENGIPAPFDNSKLDTTAWGYVPKFSQQITRAFDNDQTARDIQDVGYDGLPNTAAPGAYSEQTQFSAFLRQIRQNPTLNPSVLQSLSADPASDDYVFYRDTLYGGANSDKISVLTRYKRFNNPQGNSPITAATASFPTSSTTLPESEDINRDNTLNESESYFQYRIDFEPNMQVGSNNIINVQEKNIKMPNGATEKERWYQFKIPIRNYDNKIGGISDFRSIRFMRMFLSGWQDSTIMRFATLELGRNQWRTFRYSLNTPGENLPQQNQGLTDFTVTSVSIEQNGSRQPVPYVIPPGVTRQLTTVSQGATIQLNEQSLSLRACALQDGDARAVFKEVNIDMRQYAYLRMFIHAESEVGQAPVQNADVDAFLRIGSDFTNNYYEYRMPLTITQPNISASDVNGIWPAGNQLNLALQDLVEAKKARDAAGWLTYIPYYTKDSKGNTIVIIGNPNIGGAKNIMVGLFNPKKTQQNPGDDGMPKCIEAWFDEMRMAGINDQAGYAAAGKVAVQLADLGNLNVSGSMHTQGYGNIDQKIQQRSQDDYYQWNTSTNLSLGKLMPKTWGVTLPLYVGYTENVSTPKYDPYNQDVKLSDEIASARNTRARDSVKNVAQDFTSITSVNLTNVRIQGNTNTQTQKPRMPWSIKNFDFSYSYNNQFKRNPLIQSDELKTQKLNIGYTYSIKSKPIEPFKRFITSKSKWFSLIKDFNINPLPSTFTLRNDLLKLNERTQVRNIGDGSSYQIPPTFFKNFTWNRAYTLRWEIMKSLSMDYSATNISRVDQPYGELNTKAKKDTLWRNIASLGTNNSYVQTFNASYNVPLAKLPLTDWINMRLGYQANYDWTTAAPVARSLGNTIGNTQTQTITGDLNMSQLYNKSKWLRALNTKTVKGGGKTTSTSNVKPPEEKPAPKNVKDLRKPGGVDKNSLQRDLPPGQGGGDNGPPAGKGAVNPKDKNSIVNDTTKKGSDNKKDDKKDNKKDDKKDNKKDNKKDDKKDNKKDDKKDNKKNGSGKDTDNNGEDGKDAKNNVLINGVNTANLTDDQLDSMVDAQKAEDKARKKAEKAKKKAARKAARKLRHGKIPSLTPTEQAIGKFLTMLNRVTVNYTQTSGTRLPGWMDSTSFMGVNTSSGAPGYNFVYGYQPDYNWLGTQADAGRLTRDSLFNAQFHQTYSRNLTAGASLQPFKDCRIDLSLTQTFSKAHSEIYADTGTGVPGQKGKFNHFNPYETGSFNISYITVNTMFKNSGVNSEVYNQFLANRQIISRRLGTSNPYTNGLPDPKNPAYQKGYTEFSQDVLIPSFIAAYSGKSAQDQALIDYKHSRVSDNPFRFFTPMPNWKINYFGLSKIPLFASFMSNFVVNHSYTGTMSMNGFNSSLLFNDLYGLGFPSFIDSNSNNYIPFFQVPNVTISQAFSPLIGVDMGFKNNLTGRFEVRKSKMQSLSLIDYQISENASTEYVIGIGFRKKGIKLPFSIMGITKLRNELIFKFDLGFRDDKSTNTFLSNNIGVTSRGQQVIRISPTIDYSVSQKLTLHFFYDRQQTIPYVSNSYPTTTTRAGLTLRFIFGP